MLKLRWACAVLVAFFFPLVSFATVTETYDPVRLEADGNVTDFDFNFTVFSSSDVKVSLVNRTTDAEDLQILVTDYNVTLDRTNPGGTIVFPTAPAADQDVFIRRDMAITQSVDIPAQGMFRERQIENALDKSVMLIQQQQEEIDRCFKATELTAVTDLTLPAPVANRTLMWNANATGLSNSNYSVDDLGDAITDAETAQGLAEAAQSLAEAAQAAAQNAQAAAEDIAAGLNLPTISSGDANKFLQVLSNETGYQFRDPFPVGYIYISTSSTNPATILGYGTWTAIGAGRTLVGINASDADFDTAKETGGQKTVTLTAAQSGLPAHSHTVGCVNNNDGGTAGAAQQAQTNPGGTISTSTSTAANASEAHSVMDPYIVVYMWERTA